MRIAGVGYDWSSYNRFQWDIAVGGAGLARACMELELIDEWRLFVSPLLLGSGTPYFPPLKKRINLELIETRTFGSRVVYLRYRRVSASRVVVPLAHLGGTGDKSRAGR